MRIKSNKWESLTEGDEDEEEEGDDTKCAPLVSSSESESDEIPSIKELREMKLVTRRKSRFERNKQIKGVSLKTNYMREENC
eukprot:3979725-Karenia_brevis.AAC.1